MTRDNFSIFRTNCAILTSYIRAHVGGSRVDVVTLLDQNGEFGVNVLKIFHNDGRKYGSYM